MMTQITPSDRTAARAAFVEAHGWPASAIAPLAADASTRAYYRLIDGDRRAVLMDAPPSAESAACPPDATPEMRREMGYNAVARLAGPDNRPFAAVATWLRTQGLNAPEIYAADFDQGLLLIEDLGDDLFVRAIQAGADEVALYETAVDALAHLHNRPAPQTMPVGNGEAYTLLNYDPVALEVEVDLLPDWYLSASGRPATDDQREAFRAAWAPLLPDALPQDPVLVLRDYHAENLLWRPDQVGLARAGMIDFQDGLAGHPAYDLVSLLTDARRDVAPALADAMMERYKAARAAQGPFDADAFDAAYAILNVQRNTKILGIFARLWQRDGKPGYLAHIPRVWRHVEAGLAHPAMSAVKSWFDTHIPDDARGDALHRIHIHMDKTA